MPFDELGLSDEVLRAVSDAGYSEPTPIQEQAIPVVLMGRDILGCAQTGTGKTASFTLPMIEILSSGRAKARMPRSLILEPTRELAAQVADNFEIYGKYHKLSKALLIGGESMADQTKILERGVDVLIATPGRLMDVFDRGFLLMADIKILVIDEADRMLDMGFIPDVARIVSLLPQIRTTLFFSATMPPEIRRLADKFLMSPREISVAPPATTAETITQGLIVVRHKDGKRPGGGQKEKRAALRELIRREDPRNALIFCNRKRDVDVVFRSLVRHGFQAERLHGDMAQPVRMETLKRFKTDEIRFLVCSDVAARGLDIPQMSHVFNFDIPTHAEDYVHRIGRTGRAGNKGHAFSIAVPEDGKYLDAIVKLTGVDIPKIDLKETATGEIKREEAKPGDAESDGTKSEEDRPRRRRRSRGGRSKPSAETQPNPAPEEAAGGDTQAAGETNPKPEKRQRPKRDAGRDGAMDKGRDKSRDKGRDRNRDDGAPVKGLGDHVPAFLMQGPAKT